MSLIKKVLLVLLLVPSLIFSFPFFSFFKRSAHGTLMVAIPTAQQARTVGEASEHSSMRSLAQHIKDHIEQQVPGIRVVITPESHGDIFLYNAQQANTLPATFYVHLGCYHEPTHRQSLRIYQFSYGHDFVTKRAELAFYPYDEAYLARSATTSQWTARLKQALDQECAQYQHLACHPLVKAPYAPLIGIQVPACGIEIGVSTQENLSVYGELLANALCNVMKELA